MRWIKAISLLFSTVAMLLVSSVSNAAGGVAFVEVSRLLVEPPQVKMVREKLRREFTVRDDRLNEQQKQIKTLQDKLAQEGAFLKTAEKKRLERDILSRRLKLKHSRTELQQERQMRQDDEIEHLRRIIREVIAQVAQDEKLDMVIETGAIWVSPNIDITDKVLERLQQLAKTSK